MSNNYKKKEIATTAMDGKILEALMIVARI